MTDVGLFGGVPAAIRIDIYHHADDATAAALADIQSRLKGLQAQETAMATDLTALTAQVQATTDAEESAIQLITGLAAQIASLKNDPAALQALADSLKAESDKLAAAVTANTPAE